MVHQTFEKRRREFRFTQRDFRYLAGLLREQTGIDLVEQKFDMVYARLVRRVRALGLASFQAYIEHLNDPAGDGELDHLVNALTTNLTRFFREGSHFKHLYNVALPDSLERLLAAEQTRLRLWSAGCASGEEAYSMAMILKHRLSDAGAVDARILASDLDTNVLRQAAEGRYPAQSLSTVPGELLDRFAQPLGNPETGEWQIDQQIRDLISFKRLNLIGDWPMQGSFDAIFCRNVMIYFDVQTTQRLLERFVDILRPGGWLYIGHSENIIGMQDRLERVGGTTYRKLTST
ncbi:MAG: protein-glutamate O-methyltransferase CheR [Alphaproteobacteria bacterium]|jgi:chemotaxis protein methyltransferase CheR|nr:protein-glutamate O-methyltransferase CheR [Alphaproteobacteria bacterium]MDP6623825.1 protein-glutamate O-methyltransferase CheR [Alphaproteobacteria bacterium]|tara:strand:- start:1281 stop:2150 length:870 start_codon:yes stop_codon:yes gene_type:complete